MPGRIRVGKSNHRYGQTSYPEYPGFTPIVVLTPSSEYGELGPYALRNEQGQILENTWQFSKTYEWVPKSRMPYSAANRRIVWDWPAETHIENGQLTQQYWNWRMTGKNNSEPVRTPVPRGHLKNCKFALKYDTPPSETNPPLDYIESRKQIYLPVYVQAVVKEPKFIDLHQRWLNGENLLIIEIDGPHQESLNHYQQKWNVGPDFIQDGSIEATEQNLAIMLNDPKHPFGHGYCLAWAIMKYPS